MKERIAHTGESLGGSIIWIVTGFSLIVFTAPLSWVGESLADLRWHVGLLSVVLAAAGIVLLPRKRLAFTGLLALAMYNLFPALHVYLPSTAQTYESGTDITLVQARWENEPTTALENELFEGTNEIIVLTGISPDARKSLEQRLTDWPFTFTWPEAGFAPEGELAPESSTMVFSKLHLQGTELLTFGENASLLEATIDLDGPPMILRVVDLPPPGPGGLDADRQALLNELEQRDWPLRALLAIDLGASDTSLAYGRVCELTEFTDARQGIGRQATATASFGGFMSPGMSVPRQFTFVGSEVQVLDRSNKSIRATDGQRPLYRGSVNKVISTSLRIVE
jgi:hypothetical protein